MCVRGCSAGCCGTSCASRHLVCRSLFGPAPPASTTLFPAALSVTAAAGALACWPPPPPAAPLLGLAPCPPLFGFHHAGLSVPPPPHLPFPAALCPVGDQLLPATPTSTRLPRVTSFDEEALKTTAATAVCDSPRHASIGNESVPIPLAQCWFPGLAVSDAKI